MRFPCRQTRRSGTARASIAVSRGFAFESDERAEQRREKRKEGGEKEGAPTLDRRELFAKVSRIYPYFGQSWSRAIEQVPKLPNERGRASGEKIRGEKRKKEGSRDDESVEKQRED